MPLIINNPRKEEPVSNERIADRRLYFTADRSELVEEGDVRAAFLACAPGDPIPAETQKTEEKAAEKTEDKAADKTKNKGRRG